MHSPWLVLNNLFRSHCQSTAWAEFLTPAVLAQSRTSETVVVLVGTDSSRTRSAACFSLQLMRRCRGISGQGFLHITVSLYVRHFSPTRTLKRVLNAKQEKSHHTWWIWCAKCKAQIDVVTLQIADGILLIEVTTIPRCSKYGNVKNSANCPIIKHSNIN